MGREISYLCDGCGMDCTQDFFTVSLTRRVGAESYVFEVYGDNPILCRECCEKLLAQLFLALDGEWICEEESEV